MDWCAAEAQLLAELVNAWPHLREIVEERDKAEAQLQEERQTIASWILGLEGTYREPHVGRVLRDILATAEERPLDPPDKYPPRGSS